MSRVKNARMMRKIRHARVRAKVKGELIKPRLCVFRSLNHIYAQVINDDESHTIAQASTLAPEIRAEVERKTKIEAAQLVGSLVAKRAMEKGINKVVFDRGGYKYHGRVKALAEAAREAGLKF